MTGTIQPQVHDAHEANAPVGRPIRETHPNRLLAVAQLHGVAPPNRETISLLEIGCGDGENLVPMAASYPRGRFVGIDLSARRLADARALAGGAGTSNATFLEADVRAIPSQDRRYDVVVAHGFYSRVPPEVRDGMLRTIALHLAPGGVAYVDYDLLPGGWIGRIGRDAMQFHVRATADPAERVARARAFIALLAGAWREQGGAAAAVALRFADEAGRDDGDIRRDDLAQVNEPVYYSAFASHAARHRLAIVADVDPGTRSHGSASAALRDRLAARDPIAREQMLDFVHLRQVRQSLLVHAGSGNPGARDARQVAAGLHFAATMAYMRHRLAGGAAADPVGDLLAGRFPASVPGEEIVDALASHGVAANAAQGRVLDAWARGIADPYVDALAVATRPSARPRAGAVARWQAAHRPLVTNLRHVSVRLADDLARAILPLCDGTRSAADLAAATRGAVPAAEAPQPQAAVERRLAQFASAALLEA